MAYVSAAVYNAVVASREAISRTAKA